MNTKEIAKMIPEGSENRINRKDLTKSFIRAGLITPNGDANRDMMKILHEVRKETIVISTGSGYFRPTRDDIEHIKHYLAKEKHRIKETRENLKYAEKFYEDMKAGRI